MPTSRTIAFAACLMLALPVRADEIAQALPEVRDVVYKGLVGKALDAVPMDPEERMVLQRTSTVVSSTLTGRSIAIWAGLSNPILLVVGLVWGLHSAANIKPAEAPARIEPEPQHTQPPAPVLTQFALLAGPSGDEIAQGAQ